MEDVRRDSNGEMIVTIGRASPLTDPVTGEMVEVRIAAQARLRVADQSRHTALLSSVGGASAGLQDYVAGLLGRAIEAAMHRLLEEKFCSIIELTAPGGAAELSARTLGSARSDLAETGLEVVAFEAFALTLGAEDAGRVRESLAQISTAAQGISLEATMAPETSDPTAPMPKTPAVLAVGSPVQALWSDGRYYPAVIMQLSRGHYEVAWEAGGGTSWVGPHQLVPAEVGAPAEISDPQSSTMPLTSDGELAPGLHVLAHWTDGKVYGGTVRQRQDGYCEVEWDAGGTGWVPDQQLRLG